MLPWNDESTLYLGFYREYFVRGLQCKKFTMQDIGPDLRESYQEALPRTEGKHKLMRLLASSQSMLVTEVLEATKTLGRALFLSKQALHLHLLDLLLSCLSLPLLMCTLITTSQTSSNPNFDLSKLIRHSSSLVNTSSQPLNEFWDLTRLWIWNKKA